MKLVRYKIDGKYIYMPPMTPEQKKIHRKEYNRKWRAENPDKVKATKDRYWDYQHRLKQWEGKGYE